MKNNFFINIEYINNTNFENIKKLKAIARNGILTNLKPKASLNLTTIYKTIKFDEMPVKCGNDSFIIIDNNYIKLYSNKKSSVFFIGYKESVLGSNTIILRSAFDEEKRIIKLKNYKLIKSFLLDDAINSLNFLININKEFKVDAIYFYYGNISRTCITL